MVPTVVVFDSERGSGYTNRKRAPIRVLGKLQCAAGGLLNEGKWRVEGDSPALYLKIRYYGPDVRIGAGPNT